MGHVYGSCQQETRLHALITGSKDVIDEVFEKHDVDKDGSLNRDQLKTLLMELNDNIMPTDEEVKWVLDHADVIGDGVIDKPELMKAISLWCDLASWCFAQ
eukprot:527185-Hanusia_phi.AAC.2